MVVIITAQRKHEHNIRQEKVQTSLAFRPDTHHLQIAKCASESPAETPRQRYAAHSGCQKRAATAPDLSAACHRRQAQPVTLMLESQNHTDKTRKEKGVLKLTCYTCIFSERPHDRNIY